MNIVLITIMGVFLAGLVVFLGLRLSIKSEQEDRPQPIPDLYKTHSNTTVNSTTATFGINMDLICTISPDDGVPGESTFEEKIEAMLHGAPKEYAEEIMKDIIPDQEPTP